VLTAAERETLHRVDPALAGSHAVVEGTTWWLSTELVEPEGLVISVACTVPPGHLDVERRRVSADADWS
jgi:hypothetical protein